MLSQLKLNAFNITLGAGWGVVNQKLERVQLFEVSVTYERLPSERAISRGKLAGTTAPGQNLNPGIACPASFTSEILKAGALKFIDIEPGNARAPSDGVCTQHTVEG
jgi:hypothetical protein